MDLRGVVGRPRPFRELVVRPRPTATFPATFGVAALSTVAILSATLIGVSELGAVRGPSGHDGGRIMAMPQWPGSTSPFLGFGGAPPAVATPATTTPNTTTPGSAAGEATEQSRPGSFVGAAAVHEPASRRERSQGVTVAAAVLNTPSAQKTARTAVWMSVVSTHPGAGVLSVSSITPAATFVAVASAYPVTTLAPSRVNSPAGIRTRPSHERADGNSRATAKHGHATKARKHAHALRDAKATRHA